MGLTVRASPSLSSWISSITVRIDDHVRAEHNFERVLPTGAAGIVINLHDDELRTYDDAGIAQRASGAILSGPQTRPRVIDTDETGPMVTVGFQRGGLAGLIGSASAGIADTMVNLDAVIGRDGANLRGRLLEACSPRRMAAIVEEVLSKHLRSHEPPQAEMVHAAALLERGWRVRRVSSAIGMSEKHLVRRFRHQMGMTPKRYGRIHRLQRVLVAVHGRAEADWAVVAAQHGYFDQAHLINDFRDLTGLTPTAYEAAATTEHANHVAFLQSRSLAPS